MLAVLIRLAKRQVLRAPLHGDFLGTWQQCWLISPLQQSPAIQKYQWSQMSSHRVPMSAVRSGGWSGMSCCHEAQTKASKWNALLCNESSPRPLLQQCAGKSRMAVGLLERPDSLGGWGILMNDCSLIPTSNLLPVTNSCSCMFSAQNWCANPCFLNSAACTRTRWSTAPARDGPTHPSCNPAHPLQWAELSPSPANPPLEVSWHAPVIDRMKYHGEYEQLVFTTFEGIIHFLIDHLNFRFFFPEEMAYLIYQKLWSSLTYFWWGCLHANPSLSFVHNLSKCGRISGWVIACSTQSKTKLESMSINKHDKSIPLWVKGAHLCRRESPLLK